MKICKQHGETEHRKYPSSGERLKCLKCQVEAVARRRRKLKILSVEYLGGKCSHCGYCNSLSALEFHHKDPTQKDFSISSSGKTRSFEKIKKELDKCMILCANCHREEHERLRLGVIL